MPRNKEQKNWKLWVILKSFSKIRFRALATVKYIKFLKIKILDAKNS
jgi:hypothetical protein